MTDIRVTINAAFDLEESDSSLDFKGSRNLSAGSVQHEGVEMGICTVAAPPLQKFSGGTGLTLVPGIGKFKRFQYDPDATQKSRHRSTPLPGQEEFFNWMEEPIDVGDIIYPHRNRRNGRFNVIPVEFDPPKTRVHIKGTAKADILPGEYGVFNEIRCLWGPMPTEPEVPVKNCTTVALLEGNRYEAAFNCNCFFEVTNCCPLLKTDCPDCSQECANTYGIILPSNFTGACSCQAGAMILFDHQGFCEYTPRITGSWGFLIDQCEVPGAGSNPCECFGDPGNPPPPCTPDPNDPSCDHCQGDGISVPCSYCKNDCGHGLRHVGGFMACVNNQWQLQMNSGTAGVCPDVQWVANHIGVYEADARCPPPSMLMDFAIASTCQGSSLGCPSFQAEVFIVPL